MASFNFKTIFDMTQKITSKVGQPLEKIKERLENIVVEGSDTEKMVIVKMNGLLLTSQVTIDPTLCSSKNHALLQDSILEAINSATSQVKQSIKEQFKTELNHLIPVEGLFK